MKALRSFNLRVYNKKLNDAIEKWSLQHRRKLNALIVRLLEKHFFGTDK